MNSLGSSIRHGAAWSFVGTSSGEIFNFAIGIVLARLLIPEDFGAVTTTADYVWGDTIDAKDAAPGDILQFKDFVVTVTTTIVTINGRVATRVR